MYVSKKVFAVLDVAIEALEDGSLISVESDIPSKALNVLLKFYADANKENRKRRQKTAWKLRGGGKNEL